MASKSLFGKPRTLTQHEDQTSFDSWIEAMTFHISLSDKSTRFLPSGDLSTWTTAADRGFQDDTNETAGVTNENKMNKQAKASLLNIILGSIAGYAPVISSKFIKKQSTSLESIWDRLRSYYGFRRTGSRILDLTEIKLEPNESRECLWERLYSFLEDQLLTKNGGVSHNYVKQENDEEFTPTLLNMMVTTWLQIINPALPAVIKQRFSTQLRSCTLFTIREEISEAIPVLLSELEEKDSVIQRTSFYQTNRRKNFNQNKKKSFSAPKRLCCLCKALGKPANHFLSSCPFLPAEDKEYMSKTREITAQDEFDNEGSESENEELANSFSENMSVPFRKVDCTLQSCDIRKVDVYASPTLEVSVGSEISKWTLDSGAEANIITMQECRRLGIKIHPTSQGATQGDGRTPLPTYGEVHFMARRGHHKLLFNGLVVKHLDTNVLAGMPFHRVNHIQINYSLNYILLEDCCKITFDPEKLCGKKSVVKALRISRQTCILPGESALFQLPDELRTEESIAIEPRTTVPSDMPQWIQCDIQTPSAEGTVSIKNNTSEPVLAGKHVQICQARPTIEINQENACGSSHNAQNKPSSSSDTKLSCTSKLTTGKSKPTINIDMNSNSLSKADKEHLKKIHQQYNYVFSEGIGCYNNKSGYFVHQVNMSEMLPPQRKTRIPDYNNADKEELQKMMDHLKDQGVFSRAEDVKQPVEYVHPSFLVKKPAGGHRLVTSFGQMAEYARPQPTINSNIEHTIHQIGQFKEILITDLSSGYFQIPVNPESSKYLGVLTPYSGTYVYRRSVMGLPGSEAALEELLSRILGDLIREGKMVKIADDIILGSQNVKDLLNTWEELLRRLEENGLKLSAKKTRICPESATILGWEWRKGGKIQPSKHRINALTQCETPKTVKALRSYIGCFKFLSRVLPCYAEVLQPLEKACAGKESSEKLTWTEELLTSFDNSKKHLNKVKPITLPKRDEQLNIVTDASSSGIASTLYVVRDNKLALAGYFSAALRANQQKLIPCELEALAIAVSLKHFDYLILQSTKRTRVLTDSRPCVLAYKKLQRGQFSHNPRVTTFLSAASRYAVEILHISGSSNIFSDFASRSPMDCKSPDCSICNFIKETSSSAVGEISVTDVLSGKYKMPYTTKSSWLNIQQTCPDLEQVHKYLSSGSTVPSKRRNCTDIKRYLACGTTVLSGRLNGLLVVKSKVPFKPESNRVVIPRNISNGLLTALHIHLNHPSTYQLKLAFSREFFCLDLDSIAKKITEQCYTCASLKTVPATYHQQTTSEPGNIIGCKFSADVIRRFSQFILIVRENITSYSDGLLINDEKGETLRNGLLTIMSRLRSPIGPKAIIRTDPASGLRSLVGDKSLERFNLQIELGECKNINHNPVAESTIRETQAELIRLQPLGGKVSETTLAQAISNMNNKIRHHKLTATEAWTKRDRSSGNQLEIEDSDLIKSKYDQRISNHEASAKHKSRGKAKSAHENVAIGQLVFLYSDYSKLRSREKYMVIRKDEEYVWVQKFTNSQFRNRQYKVKRSDLIIVQPETLETTVPLEDNSTPSKPKEMKIPPKRPSMNIPPKGPLGFATQSDSTDEDSDDDDYNLSSSALKFFLPNQNTENPDDQLDETDQRFTMEEQTLGPHECTSHESGVLMSNEEPDQENAQLPLNEERSENENDPAMESTFKDLRTLLEQTGDPNPAMDLDKDKAYLNTVFDRVTRSQAAAARKKGTTQQ